MPYVSPNPWSRRSSARTPLLLIGSLLLAPAVAAIVVLAPRGSAEATPAPPVSEQRTAPRAAPQASIPPLLESSAPTTEAHRIMQPNDLPRWDDVGEPPAASAVMPDPAVPSSTRQGRLGRSTVDQAHEEDLAPAEVAGVSVASDGAAAMNSAAVAAAPSDSVDPTLRPLQPNWDPNAIVGGAGAAPGAANAAVGVPEPPAAAPGPTDPGLTAPSVAIVVPPLPPALPVETDPALDQAPPAGSFPLPFYSSPTAVSPGPSTAAQSQEPHPPVVRGEANHAENHPPSVGNHGNGKGHEKKGH